MSVIDMTGQMTARARLVFAHVSGRATDLCRRACSDGASPATHYCFVCETAPDVVDLLVLEFSDVDTDFAGDGWNEKCREILRAHQPIEGFMRVLCVLQDGCIFAGGLPVLAQQVTLQKGGQA